MRLVQPRQPILNVPPVVVAVLVALGVVHAVRLWLLSDDDDRVLVWTLAFVPARYDNNALTDGLLPGGWGADFFVSTTVASATGSPALTQSPTTSITFFIRVSSSQASVPTSRSSPSSTTCS